ncbi:hypothetical protein UN64_12855 [Fictibacillus arsenicus]|uniref:Uncharacterized protein n=1 Tax=Fictibacillus arsenicus TaxID=255247 RepID=A0A1V3G973_9BACL|nr:hypothetical protein UN64_12855 [Fictibacillus arsenicus]
MTGETPMDAKRRGGSPHAPPESEHLKRKSTTFKQQQSLRKQLFKCSPCSYKKERTRKKTSFKYAPSSLITIGSV